MYPQQVWINVYTEESSSNAEANEGAGMLTSFLGRRAGRASLVERLQVLPQAGTVSTLEQRQNQRLPQQSRHQVDPASTLSSS